MGGQHSQNLLLPLPAPPTPHFSSSTTTEGKFFWAEAVDSSLSHGCLHSYGVRLQPWDPVIYWISPPTFFALKACLSVLPPVRFSCTNLFPSPPQWNHRAPFHWKPSSLGFYVLQTPTKRWFSWIPLPCGPLFKKKKMHIYQPCSKDCI